ncbi:hypothetical protein ACIPN8_22650 [Streptomyces sp. NPDC086082]|uniref:WXG100 family type VII secretion target n=1 Tax=Streptomyces sp. NPDC086082 TaxID=3365750 RepID=UPI00380B5185
MGDEQHRPSPHQAEQTQVVQQVGVIDAANVVSDAMDGIFGGHVRFFGKTDFENHRLNDMIDMVESASPEHLETAGKALWDARDAISDAAEELGGHIGNVDWEGDSGQAFRDWGNDLVIYAVNLASFAEVAGTQISAAAMGLASVRSAMPPRDTRLDSTQTPADIPMPARVAGNKQYAAAVHVEKDRQEAINQMNRLSSFYSVSEETLAAQEPPTFLKAMPDVGVPKPVGEYKGPGDGDGTRTRSSVGVGRERVNTPHETSSVTSGHSRTVDVVTPKTHLDDSSVHPDQTVGTKIDGVGTLPSQEAVTPLTSLPPSPTGPGATNTGTVPPVAAAGVPPLFSGPSGRTSAFGGTAASKAPISAQGRLGTPNSAAAARGATGPVGRANAAEQSGIRGNGPAGARAPLARGVTGGMPRPVGGTAAGRTGGAGPTGAGRTNGVVGGKATTGAASESGGSRIPRGTVVGAENGANSRTPTGRIGQRGVVGASNPASNGRKERPGRPTTGNSDGVVGTPKGRVSPGSRDGLPGGSAGNRQGGRTNRRRTSREDREDEREREAQRRSKPTETD